MSRILMSLVKLHARREYYLNVTFLFAGAKINFADGRLLRKDLMWNCSETSLELFVEQLRRL